MSKMYYTKVNFPTQGVIFYFVKIPIKFRNLQI